MTIPGKYIITLVMFFVLLGLFYLNSRNYTLVETMGGKGKHCGKGKHGGKCKHGGKGKHYNMPRTVWINQDRGYKTISPGDRRRYFRNRQNRINANLNYIYDDFGYGQTYWDSYGTRNLPWYRSWYNNLSLPWYTPFFAPLVTYSCPKGCAMVGNNTIGCVNPTNEPHSCLFASDCYQC